MTIPRWPRRQWAVTVRRHGPAELAGRPASWHWTAYGAYRHAGILTARAGAANSDDTFTVEHRADVKVAG